MRKREDSWNSGAKWLWKNLADEMYMWVYLPNKRGNVVDDKIVGKETDFIENAGIIHRSVKISKKNIQFE